MSEHLTDLEQMLLLAVVRLKGDAWGAAIQEELEARAERRVSLGSIHVTLGRLEERGLVVSKKGDPTGERGGKARRLYAVTETGRVALDRGRRIMERLWEGVSPEPGLEP